MNEETTIPFDRLKYLKPLIAVLILTVLCWTILFNSQSLLVIVSCGLVLLPCAIVFSYCMQQVTRLGPGLKLTPHGFYDNSRGNRVGDVPWDSVIGVSEAIVYREQSLVVRVSDPQSIVDRGRLVYRLSKSGYLKNFESPIAISATKLKIETDELFTQFNQYYEKYGAR